MGSYKGGVGASSNHQRVNLCYYVSDPDGVLKRHKVYTGSGRMSLCPVRGYCLCYIGPKSLMERSNGC